MKIFVAGATGLIGRRVVRLLRGAGHDVTGTMRTRNEKSVRDLEAEGVRPFVIDALDDRGWLAVMREFPPDVVIHQLTALPDVIDPAQLADVLRANSQLRIIGTANLMAAAKATGVKRVIAQSIAFAYAAGPEPRAETDPIASPDGDEPGAITAKGVRALESAVLNAPGIDGIVLRYGRLYGPGTWFDKPNGRGPLHVDAAAHAALLAITRGAPGIYNIAEDDGALTVDKARRELGFDAAFRLPSETAC
jgi:nucleoside-diphosphate-sugar epimerase